MAYRNPPRNVEGHAPSSSHSRPSSASGKPDNNRASSGRSKSAKKTCYYAKKQAGRLNEDQQAAAIARASGEAALPQKEKRDENQENVYPRTTGQPASSHISKTLAVRNPHTCAQLKRGVARRPPGQGQRNPKHAAAPPRASDSAKPIDLVCNHFPFRLLARGPFYRYSVSFVPKVESNGQRIRLIEQTIKGAVTDGYAVYVLKDLESAELTTTHNATVVALKLALVATFEAAPIQLLNTMLKQMLRYLSLQQIRCHSYDASKAIQIPKHNLQLWPGYCASVVSNQRGTALLVDVRHKILRTDTVRDLIERCRHSGYPEWQQSAVRQIAGQIVLTRYNNRTYTVDGIDWKMSPSSYFRMRSGQCITFQQYYAQAHDVTVSDLKQPMLFHNPMVNGKPGQRIYLIPELCCMTGYTPGMRKDLKVMRDLSVHTRRPPMERAAKTQEFVVILNENGRVKETFAEWQPQVSHELFAQIGQVLPPERLLLGNKRTHLDRKAEWGALLLTEHLVAPKPLNNWLVVYPRQIGAQAEGFYRMLQSFLQNMGQPLEAPGMCILEEESARSYVQAIKAHVSSSTRFVVCLCSTARKDRYDAIKTLLCLELAVPSQCILAKSLKDTPSLSRTCYSICMQMTCKLGGELWQIKMPLPEAMIVGIDVYHDTVAGGKRSVVGFCASMNEPCTRYFSRTAFQPQGQEIIDNMHILMGEALKQFQGENGKLPRRIIVYRDGVGDGQLDTVMAREVTQFRRAFSALSADYQPRMAVIIVKKRIHTRFFLAGQGLGNPPPGTLVDSGVCHPDWFDFFLISQPTLNGTVAPTHYNVITDDTEMSPEEMQRLTYKLCHLYYNWPGTIRVPAPCQYAHKLAYLVGQSLHRDPGNKLANTLYYL